MTSFKLNLEMKRGNLKFLWIIYILQNYIEQIKINSTNSIYKFTIN